MKKALVTGSAGLVGSECVRLLCDEGWDVTGVDSDARRTFFGPSASTAAEARRLSDQYHKYYHYPLDIRDRQAVRELIEKLRPDFIVHTAGQPSHDRAASIPYDDFDVNAVGTLNLLVAVRDFCAESPFCFTSTNKVYGDRPNELPLVELDKRFEFADGRPGIDETMSVDQCMHSLFGASKMAADILCQEFGRYFDMPTGIFRAGCLTGPQHAAVELHGYLAYIAGCAVNRKSYTVFGYGGKQVRDQLHSRDLARLFLAFYHAPRTGEVYNIGGGRQNNISILETIEALRQMGFPLDYEITEASRKGDHICYISDLGKVHQHFPSWKQEYSMTAMLSEIVERKVSSCQEPDFQSAQSRP